MLGATFRQFGGTFVPLQRIGENFGTIGFLIIGAFALCWMLAAVIYRARGYDRLHS